MGSRTILVVLAAFVISILGFRLTSASLASGYGDPVARHGAQDEAVYGRAAINMAESGDWLTPQYLDRFMLNKPPLLHWLGAAATKLFGVSTFSLRLFPLVAGATTCLLAFIWVRRQTSTPAALTAAILLVGNPMFHFVSRRFLTDGLLLSWSMAAIYVASRDPTVTRKRDAAGVGVFVGLALMTKSVAGLLPLAAVFVAGTILRSRGWKSHAGSMLLCGLTALAVAAPWHLYQFFTHRYWFLSEYFGEQIGRTGSTISLRDAVGVQLAFYAQRLWISDPALCVLFVIGAGIGANRLFKRTAPQGEATSLVLLFAWFGIGVCSLIAFRYQSMLYALVIIPAMAMLATLPNHLLRGRTAWAIPALLACVLTVKAMQPTAPWRLDYDAGTTIPSAEALSNYCRLGRGNELVIVAPDDEFYAPALDLPFVRYALHIPAIDDTKIPPFMRRLGLVLRASEWYGEQQADYSARVREAGLSADRAVGTLLVLESLQDLGWLIEASPRTDFFVPKGLLDAVAPERLEHHQLQTIPTDRIWLLGEPVGLTDDKPRVCAL